jgi:branched-chain amino acid transport system ATP-binding protein
MLRIKDLDFHYGSAQALYGISMEMRAGLITIMVGSNGAGKSTLMRCISGIIKPSRGQITLEGQSIEHLPPHAIVEKGLVQVPEGRKLFPSLTVQENLEMGSVHHSAKQKRAETLNYVYGLFPRLKERMTQLAQTLSGGEQQMLAFGRALMGLPRVLLLDEPSMGLAPLLVQAIFQTIKKIHTAGGTIFLVEHNLKASLALAQWAYVIENGRIVLEGTSEQLLADERTIKAYLGIHKKG